MTRLENSSAPIVALFRPCSKVIPNTCFCSIGSGCQIGGGAHPLDAVSTSPVFLRGRNSLRTNFAQIPYEPSQTVQIDHDVWIGDGAYIKGGVHIGTGAVVGAHAVVTRDVEPYAIVVGSPARPIRKRFEERIVQGLLASRWWEWPEERLKEYGDCFAAPEDLLARIAREKDGEDGSPENGRSPSSF